MDGKAKFGALVVVIVAVLAGGVLFLTATVGPGVGATWTLVTAVVLIVLAALAIVVGTRVRKDIRAGFPKEDERSRAIKDRAGYLAFFTSLYFLLGMGFFQAVLDEEQVFARPPAEWAMIYVAIMGSIFLALHAYLSRKGVPG